MSTIIASEINQIINSLPAEGLEKARKLLISLAAKYSKETLEIPEWEKKLVLDRIKNPTKHVDAFEMIEKLEKENFGKL